MRVDTVPAGFGRNLRTSTPFREAERRSPIRRVGNGNFETSRVGDRRSGCHVHVPEGLGALRFVFDEPLARELGFEVEAGVVGRFGL